MIIASHTMPGPSSEEMNTVALLMVFGPVLVSCLLTALLAPSGSTFRRIFAFVVGTVIGTAMLTLASWLALILAIIVVRLAEDVAIWGVVAAGVLLLGVLGVFCLALAMRVTRTLCREWGGDLFAAHFRGSHDRLLAGSWGGGLLMGLFAAIVLDRIVPIGIGAMGGTLIASALILWKRHRDRLSSSPVDDSGGVIPGRDPPGCSCKRISQGLYGFTQRRRSRVASESLMQTTATPAAAPATA